MSTEDERRSVTRKAAGVGLVPTALFEIGLLTDPRLENAVSVAA